MKIVTLHAALASHASSSRLETVGLRPADSMLPERWRAGQKQILQNKGLALHHEVFCQQIACQDALSAHPNPLNAELIDHFHFLKREETQTSPYLAFKVSRNACAQEKVLSTLMNRSGCLSEAIGTEVFGYRGGGLRNGKELAGLRNGTWVKPESLGGSERGACSS